MRATNGAFIEFTISVHLPGRAMVRFGVRVVQTAKIDTSSEQVVNHTPYSVVRVSHFVVERVERSDVTVRKRYVELHPSVNHDSASDPSKVVTTHGENV